MLRMVTFRVTSCLLKQARHTGSSSQVVAQVVTSSLCSSGSEKDANEGGLQSDKNKETQNTRGALVMAAFEKLKSLGDSVEVDDSVSKLISEAKDVEGLLSIVTFKKLTRNHALKLVSVLADWTVEGRVQTAEFEKDQRFSIICRILGSNPTQPPGTEGTKPKQAASTDLSTVLGVASDDEAARYISNISLDQMVRVLSTLASKKRRSTALLRSLAYNIATSTERLDIKQGADALYAVTSLNYHDEMLVDKICEDLCTCLMANTRRAVVGSIITSLGLLRYKHTELLNLLSEWVQSNVNTCTPQDLTSLVMTLAAVHHLPTNQDTLFPMLLEQLKDGGVLDPVDWLDLVWALAVLNKQTTEHVESVLSPEFSDKIRAISTDGLSFATKLKLLNINGVARLKLKDYKGPLLDLDSEEWKVSLMRSKEKQVLVTAMQETMLNLLPSAIYLATNVDTDMGYIIDAECLVNAKLTPLPLFDKKTKAPIDRSGPDTQRGIKVAIMVLDYHDMTRGKREVTGVNVLCHDLTRLKGYRVMTVDYIDFNPKSKLANRVQYLGQQLKAAIGIS